MPGIPRADHFQRFQKMLNKSSTKYISENILQKFLFEPIQLHGLNHLDLLPEIRKIKKVQITQVVFRNPG